MFVSFNQIFHADVFTNRADRNWLLCVLFSYSQHSDLHVPETCEFVITFLSFDVTLHPSFVHMQVRVSAGWMMCHFLVVAYLHTFTDPSDDTAPSICVVFLSVSLHEVSPPSPVNPILSHPSSRSDKKWHVWHFIRSVYFLLIKKVMW